MINHSNINNREAYFKKVLKNMKLKENVKQTEIEDKEIFVENPSICSDFLDNFDLDKELTNRNLLSWIDMIENQKLHAAVKSLSLDEQTLLGYTFKKEKTQRDLAKIYKLNHRTIGRKVEQIIQKLKNIL